MYFLLNYQIKCTFNCNPTCAISDYKDAMTHTFYISSDEGN